MISFLVELNAGNAQLCADSQNSFGKPACFEDFIELFCYYIIKFPEESGSKYYARRYTRKEYVYKAQTALIRSCMIQVITTNR